MYKCFKHCNLYVEINGFRMVKKTSGIVHLQLGPNGISAVFAPKNPSKYTRKKFWNDNKNLNKKNLECVWLGRMASANLEMIWKIGQRGQKIHFLCRVRRAGRRGGSLKDDLNIEFYSWICNRIRRSSFGKIKLFCKSCHLMCILIILYRLKPIIS